MKEKLLNAIKELFPKPENCLRLEMEPSPDEFDSIKYGIMPSGDEHMIVFLYDVKNNYDEGSITKIFVKAFTQTFPMIKLMGGNWKAVKNNNVCKITFNVIFRLKTKEDIALENEIDKQKKEREAKQREVDRIGEIVFRHLKKEKGNS